MRGTLRAIVLLVVVAAIVSGFMLVRSIRSEYLRRAGLYWYDVERPYDYAFDPAAHERVAVALDSRGFTWPGAACESGFLKIELDTGWAARWFPPSVSISVRGGRPFSQYFEQGARGARYLNISPICRAGVAAGEPVSVGGGHASIAAGPSELLLFRDPPVADGPLLVVAPHPDDAEIAAFGLYQDQAASAHGVTVLTATVGDYANAAFGHLADTDAELHALVGRLRAWDSIAAPMWGGVPPERSLNLGYLGGSLPEMVRSASAEAGVDRGGSAAVLAYRAQNVAQLRPGASSTWESLVADLVHVLEQTRPARIAAPHPVLDGSAEHRLTTVALLEALGKLDARESSADGASASGSSAVLLLYNNHHLMSEYWPYGPADSLVTLPPWFGDRAPTSLGSVYSHPLTERAQQDKLFALDAMHDLRSAPRAHTGDPTMSELRRVRRTLRELWEDPHLYYSYFRRGPRPNELFFVVEPQGRAELLAAAREALAK